jgi:hypothetical protein
MRRDVPDRAGPAFSQGQAMIGPRDSGGCRPAAVALIVLAGLGLAAAPGCGPATSSAQPPATPANDRDGQQPAAAASGFYLIDGTVDTADNTGELDPIWTLEPHPALAEEGVGEGEYSIELADGRGRVLREVSIEPSMMVSCGPGVEPSTTLSFSVALRVDPRVRRVTLRHGRKQLDQIVASAHAPQIEILRPGRDGANPIEAGKAVFEWAASDEDDDDLLYTLLYSRDGGVSWDLIGLEWSEPRVEFETQGFPGGKTAMIKVGASDGFHVTWAVSEPFAVADNPPRLMSRTLEVPDRYQSGQDVILQVAAWDAEDNSLAHAIEWSSDVDGVIGTGGQLFYRAAKLTHGRHTITASVTDSGGNQVSTTFEIKVNNPSRRRPSAAAPAVTIETEAGMGDIRLPITVRSVARLDDRVVFVAGSDPANAQHLLRVDLATGKAETYLSIGGTLQDVIVWRGAPYVTTWNRYSGSKLHGVDPLKQWVSDVSYPLGKFGEVLAQLPDGRVVCHTTDAGGRNSRIVILDLETGKTVSELPIPESIRECAQLSGDRLLAGLDRGLIAVDLAERKVLAHVRTQRPVAQVGATGDGALVVLEGGGLGVVDLTRESFRPIDAPEPTQTEHLTLWGNDGQVLGLGTEAFYRFDRDGRAVARAPLPSAIRAAVWAGPNNVVEVGDAQAIFACGDRLLRIALKWQETDAAAPREPVYTEIPIPRRIHRIERAGDAWIILGGFWESSAVLWRFDPATGKLSDGIEMPDRHPVGLAVSGDRVLVLTTDRAKRAQKIHVFDLATGTQTRAYDAGPTGGLIGVTGDERVVLSRTGGVGFLELESGRPLGQIKMVGKDPSEFLTERVLIGDHVYALAFGQQAKALAMADVNEPGLVKRFEIEEDLAVGVTALNGRAYVLVFGGLGVIDLETGQYDEFKGPEPEIANLLVTDRGELYLSGTHGLHRLDESGTSIARTPLPTDLWSNSPPHLLEVGRDRALLHDYERLLYVPTAWTSARELTEAR